VLFNDQSPLENLKKHKPILFGKTPNKMLDSDVKVQVIKNTLNQQSL